MHSLACSQKGWDGSARGGLIEPTKYRGRMTGKKRSLSNTFFLNMIVVAVISIGILGTLWIIREYDQFHMETALMRERYLASQKDYLQHEVDRAVSQIEYHKSRAEMRLKEGIREKVYEAHALATHLYDFYINRLDRSQVETLIIEALRKMRFNQGRGYYFIVDMHGTNRLLDDHPENEGRNLLEVPGGKGEDVVGDMMAIVSQQGEGYYDYHWTKPGDRGDGHRKIAFVKKINELGWLIGAGEYLENVQADIQKEILIQFSEMKLGRGGYLFAGQWNGVSLTGPAAGQNMLEVTDANGVRIVEELIKCAQGGGGFLRYFMPRLDGQRAAEKISYAQAVNDWKWYVGAGLYVDEIEKSIAGRRLEMEKEIRGTVIKIALVLTGLIAFVLLLARRTAVRTRANYERFVTFFRQAAGESSLPMDPSGMNYDEFESLAHSANEMVEARQRAEKALRESQQEYQDLYDYAPDMYVSVEPEGGTVVRCNETMARKLGYAREEIVGRPILEFYHPDSRDKARDCQARFVADGVLSNEELSLIRRNGERLDIVLNASAVRDNQGRILHTRSSLSDITDLRRTQEALGESEARFRALTEKAGDLIAIVGRKGNFTYVSPSVNQFGYQSTEMVGRLLLDFLRPEDLPNFRQGEEAAMSQPGLAVALPQFQFRRKGDSWAWVEGTVNSLYHLQGVDGLVFIGRDITERIKAEEDRKILQERLLQAHKMEAVGTLAGGIAHDFNNILMSLAGYISIMEMEIKPDHPHSEYFRRIQQQVHEASKLTRQLLGFARGGKYEPRTTDLNQLTSKTVDMFARTNKDIQVQTRLDPGLWPVEVDRSQMEQVILNLLVNAGQAMSGGGDLKLHTANVTLDEPQAGNLELKPGTYVKIMVSDTGLGMDQDTLERVFDPFFTTKSMGRGAGLGLASAYGIVRNHGGAIQVHSKKGIGSTFSIYLPVTDRHVEQESPTEQPLTQGTGVVLLVDDQPPVAEVGKEMLSILGYKVITAGNGREAVDIYRQNAKETDLVILDMIMPGLSGAQTFEELKEINPEVKVLLSSGYSLNGQAEAIMKKGCRGFLQKPFNIKELSATLQAVLDSR